MGGKQDTKGKLLPEISCASLCPAYPRTRNGPILRAVMEPGRGGGGYCEAPTDVEGIKKTSIRNFRTDEMNRLTEKA